MKTSLILKRVHWPAENEVSSRQNSFFETLGSVCLSQAYLLDILSLEVMGSSNKKVDKIFCHSLVVGESSLTTAGSSISVSTLRSVKVGSVLI